MTKTEYIKNQIKLFSELLTQNKYQFKNNQRGPETTVMETPEWLYDHKRFIDYKNQRHYKNPLAERDILDTMYVEDDKIIVDNLWELYNWSNLAYWLLLQDRIKILYNWATYTASQFERQKTCSIRF